MHNKPSLTELVDKLESLGTSEHIALFFEDQGIKGDRCAAFSCAVAQYVTRETGGLFASVTPTSIRTIDMHDYSVDDEGDEISLHGSPISDFIYDFDHDKYPNLVGPRA